MTKRVPAAWLAAAVPFEISEAPAGPTASGQRCQRSSSTPAARSPRTERSLSRNFAFVLMRSLCVLALRCAHLLRSSSLARRCQLARRVRTRTFGVIAPPGAQRGTEVEVTFRGSAAGRCPASAALRARHRRVSVTPVDGDDATVKATLAIAPDCRLGHPRRCAFARPPASATCELFTVGALPEVAEVEPNNDFAAPQAIALDTTDQRRRSTTKTSITSSSKRRRANGSRPRSKACGSATRSSIRIVAILNTERLRTGPQRRRARCCGRTASCSIVAPADGKYIIQVRESSFGGNGSCEVSPARRPLPAPDGGGSRRRQAGRNARRDLARRCRPASASSKVTLADRGTELVGHLCARTNKGIAPSPIVRPRSAICRTSSKPSRTTTWPTASAGAAPGAMQRRHRQAGRRRLLQVHRQEGPAVRRPRATPADAPFAARFGADVVRNAKGGGIGSNDDTGGPDSYLRFNAPGRRRIRRRSSRSPGQRRRRLRLSRRSHAGRSRASRSACPSASSTSPTSLTVPRGNRMALLVNARRDELRRRPERRLRESARRA